MPFVESYQDVYGTNPPVVTPPNSTPIPGAPNYTPVPSVPNYTPVPNSTPVPSGPIESLVQNFESPVSTNTTPSGYNPNNAITPPTNYVPGSALTPHSANPYTPPAVTSDEARNAEIEKIKAQLEPAGGVPTPYKSLEEFTRLRNEQGIVKDEEELAALRNESALGQQSLREYKATSSAGVSQAGYLGGLSEAEKNLNFRLEGMALRERAVVDRLNSKNAYINSTLKFGKEDYATALQSYEIEYNKNLKAVQLYNEGVNEEQQDALTALTTITNLYKDKNIGELDPALKSQIESLELKAGIPTGTFAAAMQAMPDEKILSPILVENADGSKTAHFFTQDARGNPHLKKVVGLGGGGFEGSGTIAPGSQQLNTALQFAISGLSKDLRSNAVKTFNGFMSQGQTKEAQLYVEKILRDKLPSAAREDVDNLGTVKSLVDSVISYNADGVLEGIGGLYFGNVAGALDAVFGSSSQEARSVRALIGNIKGTIAKLRGGTSFTPNEQVLLESYTPGINEKPVVALNKLNLLNDFIAKKRENVLYGGQGAIYNPQTSNSSNSSLESLKQKYGITY